MEQKNLTPRQSRRRETNKVYWEDNKDRLRQRNKEYQKENKNRILEQKRLVYDEEKKRKKREYYEANRERILEQKREYYLRNKERIQQYREENKEHISELNSEYHKRHRVRMRARKRENDRRRRENPHERVAMNLRRKLNKIVKESHRQPIDEFVGCSHNRFREYFESLFKPGMRWENHGELWQVDHIRPCCSFDLTDPVQQLECFHYTNLQPLWTKDNLRKANKWTSDA